MNQSSPSLAKILKFKTKIDVVDIGANPIDGQPPYKPLLDADLATVVGFEPNPEALAVLNEKKGDNETYLPYAVFDGSAQEFRECQAEGMSSLLEPNQELLRYFHGFPKWGEVVGRRQIETVRLEDVEEIANLDFFKIDIQGGELEVFKNAGKRLEECLVIHTEVEFLPMYEGQPLFSEVELFLREQGFVFHRFAPLVSRAVQPMVIQNDIYAGLNQVFWADAVFIRDFTKFDKLSPLQLKKTALILHDIYGSWDLALRALLAHDEKAKSKLSETYFKALSN